MTGREKEIRINKKEIPSWTANYSLCAEIRATQRSYNYSMIASINWDYSWGLLRRAVFCWCLCPTLWNICYCIFPFNFSFSIIQNSGMLFVIYELFLSGTHDPAISFSLILTHTNSTKIT
jgi:hypothetical protein